jgi:hypothetical protein
MGLDHGTKGGSGDDNAVFFSESSWLFEVAGNCRGQISVSKCSECLPPVLAYQR